MSSMWLVLYFDRLLRFLPLVLHLHIAHLNQRHSMTNDGLCSSSGMDIGRAEWWLDVGCIKEEGEEKPTFCLASRRSRFSILDSHSHLTWVIPISKITLTHMCFSNSGVLEKNFTGKNRAHYSNTIHEAILQKKYHSKLPTYLASGGLPKFL